MKKAQAGGGPAAPAGTCLRGGGKDGPQLIESGGARWTEEAEAVFLDCLAASCNVGRSARQAGFSTAAVYKRRRSDPGFAARWQAAIAQGYARIETLLVKNAVDFLEGRAPDPDTPIPVMSVGDAIAILKLHRAAATGAAAKYPGWRGRPRSLDEVRDSILRKLSAIARARGMIPPPQGGEERSLSGGQASTGGRSPGDPPQPEAKAGGGEFGSNMPRMFEDRPGDNPTRTGAAGEGDAALEQA